MAMKGSSGVARAPQAPRPRGARKAEGARGAHQEEVVAVTSWSGAQTSCLRGPENRHYATERKQFIYNRMDVTGIAIETTLHRNTNTQILIHSSCLFSYLMCLYIT